MRPNPAPLAPGDAKPPQPIEAQSQRRLEAARRGEPEALGRLLAEARPRMYALALRIVGDADEAEDAVQEASVKVWRNLPRFEGRSALSTWLHRITANAALDRVRRRAPASRADDVADELRAPDTQGTSETPERLYARAETGLVVRRALAGLSAAHGETLRLCDLEGESYAAAAAATRCPIGTVMSRLYHARRKLARELATDARGEGDLEALRAA